MGATKATKAETKAEIEELFAKKKVTVNKQTQNTQQKDNNKDNNKDTQQQSNNSTTKKKSAKRKPKNQSSAPKYEELERESSKKSKAEPKVVQAGKHASFTRQRVPQDAVDMITDSVTRRKDADGYNIYKEEELMLDHSFDGEDTAACPFDCKCCY